MNMPRHLEDALHMQVADYLQRFCPVYFWHTPNSGRRTIGQAQRFKRMGVKAGIADLLFILKGGVLGAIELKVKPNRPTPEQLSFLHWVSESGGHATVCYSLPEVYAALVSWGVELPVMRFA